MASLSTMCTTPADVQGNVAYAAPRVSQVSREMEFFGLDDTDAGIAIQKVGAAQWAPAPASMPSGRQWRLQ